MKNKALVVVINLIIGNFILWFFETTARKQEGLEPQLLVGFSVTAVFLLLIAFHFIKSRQSLVRSILLAATVSFLVPVLGLTVSFMDFDSVSGALNSGLIVAFIGAFLWQWAVPMFIVNAILFRWLSSKL